MNVVKQRQLYASYTFMLTKNSYETFKLLLDNMTTKCTQLGTNNLGRNNLGLL